MDVLAGPFGQHAPFGTFAAHFDHPLDRRFHINWECENSLGNGNNGDYALGFDNKRLARLTDSARHR